MRYWCYNGFDEDGNATVVTLSEDEIIGTYWIYWYSMMSVKFGEQWVNENCTRLDCIDDWVAVNWAWESN